jgi:hypothetical protein
MKRNLFITVVLILAAYLPQAVSAQEIGGRSCPRISVSHLESSSIGQAQIYKANIEGGAASVTPTFNWTVSVGKITGGQGTSEVTVDAEGNNAITVTVEVTGYSASCPNKASYSLFVDRPGPRKFDEYGSLNFTEERLRLDQFATELQTEPTAKGYILIYDRTDTLRNEAGIRGEKARNYLIKERGFQEEQIVVVNGGYREKRSVELFIVPEGALPPMATPKVIPK